MIVTMKLKVEGIEDGEICWGCLPWVVVTRLKTHVLQSLFIPSTKRIRKAPYIYIHQC